MTKISLIAAMDERRGLGKDNQLLCHLPADLKHFKNLTLGKPIIMGRHTYQSIGRPLPGRRNIVISRQALAIEGVELVDSIPGALALAADSAELFIIGGATIYQQTLPQATQVYLTLIHHQFSADVFFPDLDPSIWHCQEIGSQQPDEKNKYAMTFFRYERRHPAVPTRG